MSALGMFANGGSPAIPAEPEAQIYVSESDASALITVALEDTAVEMLNEMIVSESTSVLFEGVLPEETTVLEKSIIKLDRTAQKQRAYKLAILQCAREDDNKDLKKLETLWQMEKYLFRKLEKRYATQARARMKQAAKKSKPKTNAFKRAANNLTRSQKETHAAMSGKTKPPKALKTEYGNITKKLQTKIS